MKALNLVKLPFRKEDLPEGFMSKEKINLLYQLAQSATSILEIGSWVGRSTCVIAHAIKDNPVPFHTVDLYFSSEEEWRQSWRQRFKTEMPDKLNKDLYLKFINSPGGSLGALKRHLEERGLEKLVIIHKGDFRQIDFGRKFRMIFCDVSHNAKEIRLNIPSVLKLLEPNGILVCDDISTDALEERLLRCAEFEWHHRAHRLFYGRLAT